MVTGRTEGDQYQAAWLCYINGLEIPVMSVQTTFGIWQMPTATIQIAPHPMVERIGQEDRLQIALFFLDEFVDPTNPQFRLLGEFEVTGWAYSSSPLGRAITLNCVSHIQIFKQMFFSQLSAFKDKVIKKYTGQTIYEQGELVFNGVPSSKEQTSTPKGKLVAETTTEVVRATLIKRPIDLVLHIFRAILSPVNAPKVPKAKKKTAEEKKQDAIASAQKSNISSDLDQITGEEETSTKISQNTTSVIKKNFFARWMKMTGFHKRWIALPLFEEDLISGGVFPIIKETGGYKALKSLSKYANPRGGSAWDMLMQIYIPMYMELAMIPSPSAVSVAKNVGKILGSKTKGTSEFRGLTTFFIKPQCVFSLIPMCNVLFTSTVDTINFAESYIDQPTRLKIQVGRGSSLSSVIASGMGSLFKSIVQRELAGGFPWTVQKRIQQYMGAPGANDDNLLLFPEEFFKGPVIRDLGIPAWLMRIQKAYSGSKSSSIDLNAWKKITDADILEFNTYSGITQEDIDSWKGTSKYAEEASKIVKARRDAQAEAVLQIPDTQTSETSKDSTKGITVPKGAQALIAKYVQYEFFKAKYEQRNASVNLTGFNPYVVPGFPGIGFDNIDAGMHLVGYITNIAHTWSSQSGSPTMNTSVNLGFARTLSEHLRDNVPEPLSTVGKILQNTTNATKFYTNLFFRTSNPNKPILYDTVGTLESTDSTFKLMTPTAAYQDVFTNYGDAMRLVARPACTLIEYAELWHNKSISQLESENVLRGKRTSFYSSLKDPTPNSGLSGAIFWDRIYKLKQGPGTDPGITVTNVSTDGNATASKKGKSGWKPVDDTHGNMVQTRNDWDTILELYRKILYSEDGFLAPQE